MTAIAIVSVIRLGGSTSARAGASLNHRSLMLGVDRGLDDVDDQVGDHLHQGDEQVIPRMAPNPDQLGESSGAGGTQMTRVI